MNIFVRKERKARIRKWKQEAAREQESDNKRCDSMRLGKTALTVIAKKKKHMHPPLESDKRGFSGCLC